MSVRSYHGCIIIITYQTTIKMLYTTKPVLPSSLFKRTLPNAYFNPGFFRRCHSTILVYAKFSYHLHWILKWLEAMIQSMPMAAQLEWNFYCAVNLQQRDDEWNKKIILWATKIVISSRASLYFCPFYDLVHCTQVDYQSNL